MHLAAVDAGLQWKRSPEACISSAAAPSPTTAPLPLSHSHVQPSCNNQQGRTPSQPSLFAFQCLTFHQWRPKQQRAFRIFCAFQLSIPSSFLHLLSPPPMYYVCKFTKSSLASKKCKLSAFHQPCHSQVGAVALMML